MILVVWRYVLCIKFRTNLRESPMRLNLVSELISSRESIVYQKASPHQASSFASGCLQAREGRLPLEAC